MDLIGIGLFLALFAAMLALLFIGLCLLLWYSAKHVRQFIKNFRSVL